MMSLGRGTRLMAKRTCVMHLHLWLETEKGLFFGPGRAELLDLIERFGSLRKAAEELGMSYRAAWGKLKKTEEVLGFKLIDKSGSYKEGYRLTDTGRAMRKKFTQWRREVEEDALAKARDIFSCEVIRKEDSDTKVNEEAEK
jgi:molybdate transport system regulatory protein